MRNDLEGGVCIGIVFEIQFNTVFLESALTISFDVSCSRVHLECQH
jgi:hypothetical protein